MHTVHRANKVIRAIRRIVFRIPERKYFISGDRACREFMRKAPRRPVGPDPEAASIFAWARYELAKEILDGFWEKSAAKHAVRV